MAPRQISPWRARAAYRNPAQAREPIVQDLLRRVRYLLTLKARPPFGLAGLEMYERLTEVVTCPDRLLDHQPEASSVVTIARRVFEEQEG